MRQILVLLEYSTERRRNIPEVGIKMTMSSEVDLATFQFIKGDAFTMEDAKRQGKAVVIEMWATWCPPCRRSIPHLTQLQQRYANDVIFLGVTTEDAATIRDYVDKMGNNMEYHVAVDPEGRGASGYLSRQHNISSIPYAFLFNKYGKLVWSGHPMSPEMDGEVQLCASQKALPVPVDLSGLTAATLQSKPIKELKSIIESYGASHKGCAEKTDLVHLILSLKVQ